MTATSQFRSTVLKVSRGEAFGDVGDLLFRDPEHFRAGELIAGKKLSRGILRFNNLKFYMD